jgi:cephalosporin hydroxylase
LNAVRLLPEPVRGALRRTLVEWFHRLFYYDGASTWSNTTWLGVSLQKCPLDLWVYQELLASVKPAVIVECGTAFGGSAYFLASLCELLEHGEVITIDVESRTDRPVHERVTYLTGSSTDPATVASVEEFISGRGPVLVLLDSDHSKAHVLSELRLYAPLVTPGSYLVVEDSNVNGHPVLPDFGPGPMEAIKEFLEGDTEFSVDRSREKYFLTFNPSGYLRKTG